ncbi:MAG: peptidase caspase catalytic subunit p20 [Fibrobacteres bacterium]|nr:peptidase caspase catalytic subunit p20 [Fibrobacterota bacterium]
MLCLCLAGRAEVRRISLFIGVDQGLESEVALKFASRDAAEMAGLFRQTGLYGPENVMFQSNASLDQIRRAMSAVEATAIKWKSQGAQTYLFVYFSGHGDAQSLHVRGQKLKRDDLVAWLNSLPCELKIVVLDACESGDFLRSKGGRFLQDLPVRIDDNLKSHGVVIVSSTSRGELAQESDEYRGAVFTHHLVNGLRGLADYNRDGWVSLQESFEYARRATATDVAMSGALHQNPSFDVDLVGGSDPGLIPIDREKSWMLLRHFPSGTLDVFDAGSLDLVSRVWLSGADSLAYRIQTGSYLFRFREGGREYLHSESVSKNGGVLIDRTRFQEKVARAWASKGGYSVRLNGFQTAYGSPHPFPGFSMGMARLSYVSRTASDKLSVFFGVGSGRSSDSATGLSNRLDLYRMGVARTFFLAGSRRIRFSAGGMAAYNLVRQSVRDGRFAGPDIPGAFGTVPADQTDWFDLYQAAVPLELEWNVTGRFWISGELDYSVYGYQDRARNYFRTRLEMEPFLQMGFHL